MIKKIMNQNRKIKDETFLVLVNWGCYKIVNGVKKEVTPKIKKFLLPYSDSRKQITNEILERCVMKFKPSQKEGTSKAGSYSERGSYARNIRKTLTLVHRGGFKF